MRISGPLAATECQSCRQRATGEFCNLDGAASSEFEKLRRTVAYLPGQYVFYEGHAALGLYILCTGRVKLTHSTKRGRRRLVGIVDPGMLIEKPSFEDSDIHEVSCEALEPSRVCVIDRSGYLELLERNGELAVKVIKLLSRHMRGSLDEIDQFAFASCRERLAGLLLDLGGRYGQQTGDGCRITLQLKREELAEMAAMNVETSVRILKTFRTSGLIRLKGREITIVNPERLARIAKEPAASGSRR